MSPLYFVVGDDVHIDSEVFLVIDFVNLKIKSVQFFRSAHRYRLYICTCVHRSECSYVYKYLRLYYIFKKRLTLLSGKRAHLSFDGRDNRQAMDHTI
jgi:hypothetical protein